MIVGGVDLLAKAEEQEKLLQESNNELEERRRRAEQLRRELEEKEVYHLTHCITIYYFQEVFPAAWLIPHVVVSPPEFTNG